MKTLLFGIIIFVTADLKSQTIDESFMISNAPDNAWMLEFDKNGDYKYYNWNGWGETTILNKGKYDLKNGVLRLRSIERDSSYKNEIPSKLFFTKMSKKEFENLGINLRKKVFAYDEKVIAFNKKYLVLSRVKLHF